MTVTRPVDIPEPELVECFLRADASGGNNIQSKCRLKFIRNAQKSYLADASSTLITNASVEK